MKYLIFDHCIQYEIFNIVHNMKYIPNTQINMADSDCMYEQHRGVNRGTEIGEREGGGGKHTYCRK